MNISEINIYPIKSLKGISVESALIEDRGLQFDRRWMLVDDNRQFITQREVPKMATVKMEVARDGLVASSDGNRIFIPSKPETSEAASVIIWSSSVTGEFYPKAIDDWFSESLGTKCRLVSMPETTKRAVNPLYAVRKLEDTVSFADGYPFMLIGEGSLSDLNSRLDSPVPMNRFRPNFVVTGSKPFDEDDWKLVRIGATEFHIVKPCERCVITTIDQESGEKGKEPLKTLSGYRNRDGKVLFGQNLIAETAGGTVRIGDEVTVIERK